MKVKVTIVIVIMLIGVFIMSLIGVILTPTQLTGLRDELAKSDTLYWSEFHETENDFYVLHYYLDKTDNTLTVSGKGSSGVTLFLETGEVGASNKALEPALQKYRDDAYKYSCLEFFERNLMSLSSPRYLFGVKLMDSKMLYVTFRNRLYLTFDNKLAGFLKVVKDGK